ncbi:NAD(P)/FAD-dependent oxidoreductase [Candidatus Uhrbacteria bacterium]|nr:NAD(P)/FAD-dependent oxidoreductase [Candidatus Uhrbacteria bacterium]
MSKIPSYDVLVIGSGAAGFSAVEAARAQEASVCLVEAGRLGGECPNDACVPSKALLKAAQVYRQAQHAREFGVQLGQVSFDFSEIMRYRQSVVNAITGDGERGARYEKILKSMKVEVKFGKASFVDDHIVEVGASQVQARSVVIATGSVDFIPPIPGLDSVKFLGSADAMKLKRQPKAIAIIGGGPVGCELATFFALIGTRVVLLQSAPMVLHREDEEISKLARQALEGLKIELFTNASVVEVVNGGGGVYGLKVDVAGNRSMHAVEQVLVATGKRACTKGLAVEEAGIRLGKRGEIETNKEQKTNVPNIFAAGDVAGGMMFTHTAHHEGWVAGTNAALVAKKKRSTRLKSDERVVPRCTFVVPEVASVGLTQAEAQQAFKRVLVGRADVSSLGRSVTDNARFGLLKIVAHPKTRKVLGGHMMGERAGEVIHEIALAIHLGATIDKLATLIHAYPTYSEAVVSAAATAQFE